MKGEGGRNHLTAYAPLLLAALKGDWDFAREFFILNPQALCARITRNQETALHVAAGARHIIFVRELADLMTPDDLAVRNKVGNTALCFAAASGVKKIAEVMVNKNKNLPSIRGGNGVTPLCMAALLGHQEMVSYLYSVTEDNDLTEEDRIELLVAAINTGIYGDSPFRCCCLFLILVKLFSPFVLAMMFLTLYLLEERTDSDYHLSLTCKMWPWTL